MTDRERNEELVRFLHDLNNLLYTAAEKFAREMERFAASHCPERGMKGGNRSIELMGDELDGIKNFDDEEN